MSTTTTTTAKVEFIPFKGADLLALTFNKSKGTAYGIDAFEGLKGLYSQALQGGMKGELSATTAKHLAIIKAFKAAPKELTPAGKAFVKIAPSVLALCKGRPATQDAHDSAMLEISAMWAACFKDAPAKPKAEGETMKAKCERLEAENLALRIERDALAQALQALQSKAPKKASA